MQFIRLTLLCLLACAVAGCAPEPKDAVLIKNFQDHREEFEALRVMISHDYGLHRVDADWTNPADPMSIGVTPERIAEYRAVFQKLGIPRGFYSYPASIDLIAHTEGISISGSSKGYSWLPFPPAETVSDLDEYHKKNIEESRRRHDGQSNSWDKYRNGYRQIEGNWYLHWDT